MANNETRDEIIRNLFKIGKEFVWPIARDAFYRYREEILKAYNVPPEERAALLEWLFEDGEPTTPPVAPPVPPTTPPSVVNPGAPPTPSSIYATLMDPPIPSDDELLARGYNLGDKVCPGDAGKWMVVKKGQPTLGAPVLRTIGG